MEEADWISILVKLAALAVLLAGGRAFWLWWSTRGERAIQAELQDALNRGDLIAAAEIQVSRGLFREAARIFLRANEPRRAAQELVKVEDHKGAAEAFEKANDFAAAAPLFQKAGVHLRAAECFSKQTSEEALKQAVDLFKAAGEHERAEQVRKRLAALSPAEPAPIAREPSQPSYPLPPSLVATEAGAVPVAAVAIPPAPRSEPSPLLEERFELRGELGRGGMGVVYRAHDRRLDRLVAMKFLPSDIPNDSPLVAIFRREARAAAALSHPGIVTVYDVGTMDGREYIAMELVEGTTLEAILQSSGPILLPEGIDLAEKVLEAVNYAHGKGIIHRDIKPSNLMKTKLGGIKVMDFGLAKSLGRQTNAHTVMGGTPAYMPPEQIGGAADHRSDVFALGATFYEMFTGQLPGFPGQPACQATGYPSPKELVPGLPARLSDLLMQCLEHDRALRLQDVATVLRELREIRKQLSSVISDVRAFLQEEPSRPLPSSSGPLPSPRKLPQRALIPREDPED